METQPLALAAPLSFAAPPGYAVAPEHAEQYRRVLGLQSENPRSSIIAAARMAEEEAGATGFPKGSALSGADDLYRRAKQIQLRNPAHPWMSAYRAAQDEAEAVRLAGAAGAAADPNLALNPR